MPDIHKMFPKPNDAERSMMEPRIQAFIFPNTPRTAEEQEAFSKAVDHQIDHEKTIIEAIGSDVPQGMKGFTIGHFSMDFQDGAFSGDLNRRTICPTAYGLLLRAGLLYKGIGRGC